MFKIRRIKTLQNSTPLRNLSNEFINEQGSCATLKGQLHGSAHVQAITKLNSIVNEPIECEEITHACVQNKLYGPTINEMFNTKFDIFCVSP